MDEFAKKKLKCIELFLDETTFDTVSLISLVNEPAVEENFMLFSAHKPTKNIYAFAKGDSLKQEITGLAMRPNKNIFRINELTGEEYEVFFSEETVKKASQLFMKQNRNTSTSIDHEVPVTDCYLFESWIVEDPTKDKATALGFEDVKKGDWYVTYKIENKSVWDAIVAKSINGFSIEGFFSERFGKTIIPEQLVKDEFLKPTAGETKEEYLPKCISYAIDKEGKTQEEAVAMCNSMWEQHDADHKFGCLCHLLKQYDVMERLEQFKASNISQDSWLGNFREADLDLYYTWQLDPEEDNCPSCLEFASYPPMKLIEWLDIALPGKPDQTNIAGYQTDYPYEPFGTFCEMHCHCTLVLTTALNPKPKKK